MDFRIIDSVWMGCPKVGNPVHPPTWPLHGPGMDRHRVSAQTMVMNFILNEYLFAVAETQTDLSKINLGMLPLAGVQYFTRGFPEEILTVVIHLWPAFLHRRTGKLATPSARGPDPDLATIF